MDQGTIRIHGVTALLGVLARDIDGALNAPTETSGFGSDDLHGSHGGGKPAWFKQSRAMAYLAGTPQTSAST